MLTKHKDRTLKQKFELWQKGYGVTHHKTAVTELAATFVDSLPGERAEHVLDLMAAADRVCSAGQWLTSLMTYAEKVYLDGRPLQSKDCKKKAQGHLGGALNMVPAYTGYLLANAFSGHTRAWLMGQGHCVAAIESINTLVKNQYEAQTKRYPVTDEGLSQLCHDFYSYEINQEGEPVAPLGSHVNPHTAGGISEGGYLGFAGLQYAHMPLPGQELVTFLSDGAFEEQRGSDWATRWWRAEDTGLVLPIMIANGRRIDQRTSINQKGGVDWLQHHLTLNGFDPFVIDGADPAAYAFAILSMAERTEDQITLIEKGKLEYPIKIPYAIAEVAKGYGLPNAGTNAAHSLPLGSSLQDDDESLAAFNAAIETLYVAQAELNQAVTALNTHEHDDRPPEHSHFMRDICRPNLMLPELTETDVQTEASAMRAVDEWFVDTINANPSVRFRVGNPDEMSSNRLKKTLSRLKHRVNHPEPDTDESIHGGVITALNEEAVVCSALGNKQGVSLVVSYEAFAMKMLGAIRQEMLFSRHQIQCGYQVNWISIPIIVTSHTWENGKNEQSHQDPTFTECCMKEMSDVAPVYFPYDANTALAALNAVYKSTGRIAALVVSKRKLPVLSTMQNASQAIVNGLCILSNTPDADVQLLGVGAYQVQACLEAAQWMNDQNIKCSVIALTEPGRFRSPRDPLEADYCHDKMSIDNLIPYAPFRVIVSHTRSDIMTDVLRTLDTGIGNTAFMGYKNAGGTLDVSGMQYVNEQTWAHIAQKACQILQSNGKSMPSNCKSLIANVYSHLQH